MPASCCQGVTTYTVANYIASAGCTIPDPPKNFYSTVSCFCLIFAVKGHCLETKITPKKIKTADLLLMCLFMPIFEFLRRRPVALRRKELISEYSGTTLAQTPMARLPWLIRTHF